MSTINLLLQELLSRANANSDQYEKEKDLDLVREDTGIRDATMELYCKAGQSKRVWGELYKVG